MPVFNMYARPWPGAVALLAVGATLVASGAGRADHRPYIQPDGSVVYGDWGLYRPGFIVPMVDGPAVIYGVPGPGVSHYFPTNRNDPNAYRRPPKEPGGNVPAEPYYRSWGAQSQNLDPNSATVYPPFAPPDVIYAPEINTPMPRPHPNRH